MSATITIDGRTYGPGTASTAEAVRLHTCAVLLYDYVKVAISLIDQTAAMYEQPGFPDVHDEKAKIRQIAEMGKTLLRTIADGDGGGTR